MMCTLYSVGDGRLGYPEAAPYDAIHVGAAAATIPKAVSTKQPMHPSLFAYTHGKNANNIAVHIRNIL